MKVYIIKAKRVAKDADWFIWNVYSSKEQATSVCKDLVFSGDDYIYIVSEYEVIGLRKSSV